MTADQNNHTLMMEITKALGNGEQGLRPLLEILLNIVMKAEREQTIGAAPYERNEERAGYANGYKDKTWHTRSGPLQLKVPQVRGLSFYPACLEKGSRSERALKLAVAEMYVMGVSTRKVEAITEQLCGLSISSSQVSRMAQELDEEFERFRNRPLGRMLFVYLDAIYVKVRHQGTVIDMACLIAFGIDEEGRRQILGVSMELSEAEVHWRSFLERLLKRGLGGVKMIISDDHSGLRAARMAVFPSIPWQRCQFHMAQNAQSYAPKKSLRGEIAEAMRSIFQSRSLPLAKEAVQSATKRLKREAPDFASWLEANIDEGLTVHQHPPSVHKKLRTTNGLERVNRELKRRIRVAVMFPNRESALRLITGVLVEIHEDWQTSKRYLVPEEGEQL